MYVVMYDDMKYSADLCGVALAQLPVTAGQHWSKTCTYIPSAVNTWDYFDKSLS